ANEACFSRRDVDAGVGDLAGRDYPHRRCIQGGRFATTTCHECNAHNDGHHQSTSAHKGAPHSLRPEHAWAERPRSASSSTIALSTSSRQRAPTRLDGPIGAYPEGRRAILSRGSACPIIAALTRR